MKIRKLKSFEKAYLKMPDKVRDRFKVRLVDFVNGRNLKVIKPHPLKGNLKSLWAFRVSGNYRCIYKKENDLIILIDIGRHSKIYE